MPGLTGVRRKRTDRGHPAVASGIGEASAQVVLGSKPAVEKASAVARDRFCPLLRKNRSDCRDPTANVRDTDESVVFDMHLAVFTNVSNVAIVSAERDPAWPDRGPGQAQPSGDDRSQPVSTDHDGRAQLLLRPGCSEVHDSTDRAVGPTQDIGDACALNDLRACFTGPAQQYRIEQLAADGQPAITERAKPVGGGIVAARGNTVRGAHLHSLELRPQRVQLRQHPHVVEDAGRLRAEALGAWLRAGKTRAFQHAHSNAETRKLKCRARAGRSTTHDHDFRLAHCHAEVSIRQRYRAIVVPNSAPATVLNALTPSLSSQRSPAVTSVIVPHR